MANAFTTGDLDRWCLDQPEAAREYPFGEGTAVYKVHGKMFALVPEAAVPASVSLKCDPDFALELRASRTGVSGGYHLNKRHWNTVVDDGSVTPDEVLTWIEDSYDLVVAGLPKATRLALQGAVRARSDEREQGASG